MTSEITYSSQYLLEKWLDTSSSLGSDKLNVYFETLSEIFNTFNGRSVTVLEIGTQRGGNLVFLRNILPAGSTVVGIDIHPPSGKLPDGINFIKGNSTHPEIWTKASEFGPYDLIIEDASHIQNDVWQNFQIYSELLKVGGFIMIEDTQYAIIPGWGRGLAGRKSVLHKVIKDIYPKLLFTEKGGPDSFTIDLRQYSVTLQRVISQLPLRIDSKENLRRELRRPKGSELFYKWATLILEQERPFFRFKLVLFARQVFRLFKRR